MKKLLVIVIALAAFTMQAAAQEIPLVQNPYGRSHQLLNGAWNYIVDQQEVGYYSYRREPYDTGFFLNHKPTDKKELVEYDFDLSPVMQIPSDWNTADQKLFHYEGTIWFKRSFDPTPALPSREGVSYNTQHQSSPLGGNERGRRSASTSLSLA